MITQTALNHLTTRCKIHGAMIRATTLSRHSAMKSPVVIRNKRGQVSMLVWHVRHSNQLPGIKTGFVIQDASARNITGTVFNSLRKGV